ncbi:BON domain-containing protein [Microbacterium sp. SSW1-49]|uniref:BON domain-containing protein n=1 Tax=Microbacterium croceum TaxID=2851645 RepID=A0ABT0FGN7_9MICO|nr:BON domain-containing protein [Microbacterium croceum]MCK2037221.1 BON domain-containing protein [Microbacterium croceum]
MTIATDRDLDVQTLVTDELEWTPDVDSAGIGVAVEDGAVTLSGEVDTYAERLAAKRAAFRVRGVRAVVDNLTVHPRAPWPVTETDIAKEVERALERAANVPDTVHASIDHHNVTLTGEVDWDFQRKAAKRSVQYLRGVYTVNSMITLKARPSATDTSERITNALARHAQIDARNIHVKVDGGRVTLTGTVRSWAESHQAEDAAWSSPHVTDVDNRINVSLH